MINYSKDKLDKGLYLQALSKWTKQQLVSPAHIPPGYMNSNSLYKPYDWLKRIGLYLVTFLVIQSCTGFVLAFLMGTSDYWNFDGIVMKVFTLVTGVALFFTLNKYIRTKSIYKHGTDDVWLHSAVAYTYYGWIWLFDIIDAGTDAEMLLSALSLLCISGFSAYVYTDSLLFIICLLCLNFIPLQLVSMFNQSLLFFSAVLVVPLNIFIIRGINKYDVLACHYWSRCFDAGKVVACMMMYVSVNLYVIRSLAYELMSVESIPLQPLFLTLTILTPLVFIVLGIKQKHKYMLYSGLFLLLPTVATVRYYYSVMPVELACMIGGLVLILVCYFAIRYLQQTEKPYTFEPDTDDDFSDAEALILLQQFGKIETPASSTETQMGGGSFGGGGSGGGF